MKKELSDLARELLSRSDRFESPEAERESFRQSLEKMGTLEPIARSSMPRSSQPAVADQTKKPLNASHASPLRATRAVCTSRREYEPALKDLSVVEALLELQNRKPARAASNPKPAAKAKANSGSSASLSSAAAAAFATPQLPRVDLASESLAFERRMRALDASPVLRKPKK